MSAQRFCHSWRVIRIGLCVWCGTLRVPGQMRSSGIPLPHRSTLPPWKGWMRLFTLPGRASPPGDGHTRESAAFRTAGSEAPRYFREPSRTSAGHRRFLSVHRPSGITAIAGRSLSVRIVVAAPVFLPMFAAAGSRLLRPRPMRGYGWSCCAWAWF